MNSIRRSILFLAAMLPSLALAAAPDPQTKPAASVETRVALVGITVDPRLQSIRDLAEVQLDQPGQVQVLERQNVERILAEQGLSLSAMVDANRAVKVGKVLAADLLAIVESSPKSQGATLVIFDPASGVRLWDSALVIDDGDKAAAAIVNSVREAAAKRNKIADLHTICLMTVRNADLPHDMDGFCDAVGRLLERNLVGSSGLALLERSRLEKVEHERALSADAAGADLFPSLVIVELEVARADSSGALRAAAFLSDSTGKSLGKLTALTKERDDAVGLADRIADQFAAHLNVPADAKVDRAAEASRFYAEAQLWTSASDYFHAMASAEAAHALAPDNVIYRGRLAHALVFCGACRPIDGGKKLLPADAFPLLARGAAMLPDLLPLSFDADPASGARTREMLSDAAKGIRAYVGGRLFSHFRVSPQVPFPPDDLAAVMGSLRRYLLMEDARLAEGVTSPQAMDAYSFHLATLLDDIEWVYSRSAGEWAADHERLCGQWLDLYAKYHRTNFTELTLDAIVIDSPFARKIAMVHNEPVIRRIRRWDPAEADYEHLESLCRRMQADPDPMIGRFGDWCALSIAVSRAQGSADQVKQCVGDYIDKMKTELDKPQLAGERETRRQIYHLMAKADGLLEATPWIAHFGPEMLDFALSRHEIECSVVSQGILGTHEYVNLPAEEVARRIAAIERLHQVLGASDCQFLDRSFTFTDANYQVVLARLRHPQDAQAGHPTTRPSDKITNLVDVIDAEEGLEQVMAPVVEADSVYAVGAIAGKPGEFLQFQLLRMPLAGGVVERLGSLPTRQFGFRPMRKIRSSTSMRGVTASCLAEGRYAAATWEDGILIYRTDGGPGVAVTEKEGLPTSCARSVAILDGNVFAGLGVEGKDAYLVSYQLSSGRVDVIASNARKDRRSPFDDGAVFTIRGLTADPTRHRLIIAIQRFEAEPKINGIWEYTPETDRWRLLLAMPLFLRENSGVTFGRFTEILAVARPRNDRLPVATNLGVFLFDLQNERASVVFQHDYGVTLPLPISRETPFEDGTTPLGRTGAQRCWAPFPRVFEFLPPYIWTGCVFNTSWTRTNLKTGQNEYFGTFRDDGCRFDPCWMESTADGSKLIVGDYYGLWVLTR